MKTSPALLLGIDVGSVNVKVALCEPDGARRHARWLPHQGRPLAALRELLLGLEGSAEDQSYRVAVTGSGQSLLDRPGMVRRINEVVAATHAARRERPTARTVVDLGGQFSKWILLAVDGDGAPAGTVLDFAMSGLCAAGSGAFLEQQAGRLHLTVEEVGRLASQAPRGATIAGRCSVFAKSDMIHLQQRGTPVDQIALGLCQALVRTFLSTVLPGREVSAPVLLVGGGAANPGLVRAFRDELHLAEEQVLVAAEPFAHGALGAARLALDVEPVSLAALLDAIDAPDAASPDPAGEHRPPLAPLAGAAVAAVEAPVEARACSPDGAELFLGIDVGSVSTKLVALDPAGRLLQGVYLATRGQPVAVLVEGLAALRERLGPDVVVLGVGATGSGRHLVNQVAGADVVHNEITAQLVAAADQVPDVETIFEIGGQDSKYVSVRGGHLASFEMNKICAAGTGSFLEEQAERLGVRIVDEFAGRALAARSPVDLGTRCTVFIGTELVRAQLGGALVDDLCAGLAYAVARNYLEKVVAGRPVGRRVVLQGGTAANAAVVAAFAKLLGRTVTVHPNARVSGAIGAALLAARRLRAAPFRTAFRGFEAASAPEVSVFTCRSCENRCEVSAISVEGRVAHFGDVCERYSVVDREQAAPPRPFPDLFAARAELFAAHVAGAGAGEGEREPPAPRPRLGLVRASLQLEFMPLWAAFLRELGYEPVVGPRTTPGLLQSFGGDVPPDACLPIKVAAAHVRAMLAEGTVERVFVPGMLECPRHSGDERVYTCLYHQQLADMLRADLRDHVVTAQFAVEEGVFGLVEPVMALARALERRPDKVVLAFNRAWAAQEAFTAARTALGQQTLAARFDRAVVVLGKPYNLHDPYLNLNLARHLERLGIPAVPGDLLPLQDVPLDERWRTMPWHFNREQLRAVQFMRDDGRLFPLLVSNYGCGPDAFTVKHVEELLAHRPRLFLEFDEHRGEAGMVTRLEAFADEMAEHVAAGEGAEPAQRSLAAASTRRPRGKRFFVPNFGPQAPIYASIVRAYGLEAELLPPPDEATVRAGEEFSSGRECHPFSVMAGELVRLVRRRTPGPDDVFLNPYTSIPCLLRQYGDGFRTLLQRHGLPPIEVWDAGSAEFSEIMGTPGLTRMYEAVLATEILYVLATRLRPYEERPGTVDVLYEAAMRRVCRAVEAGEHQPEVLAGAARDLWDAPRRGAPGDRPVVGVTGDLYTRVNPVANANLFRRLEAMGCEVWPSPFMAGLADLNNHLETPRSIYSGRFKDAMTGGVLWALATGIRTLFLRRLPPEVQALAVEPPPFELLQLAAPYAGPGTNPLVLQSLAKLVDFLRRGAAGAINAVSLNCMVGTATAAAIPALRAAHDHAPVITLIYGASEGPEQRLRLETFVHQVMERRQAPRPAATP